MSERNSGWKRAMVVTVVGFLLATSACVCPDPCPDPCPECPDETPCPGSPGSTPEGGPIIDIIVDPLSGNVEYKKTDDTGTNVIVKSNSGDFIDPAFLKKIITARFVNDQIHVMWSVKNNHSVGFTKNNGDTVTMAVLANKLSITCNVGGTDHPISPGTTDDGVPDCMRGTLNPKNLVYYPTSGTADGNWFHLEFE